MLTALVGNEFIKQRLADMIRADRLVHAFIIEGNEGSGRHTLASIIAASATCTAEQSPCGECKFCHASRTFAHPDILLYKPAKTVFTVGTVRDIISEAYMMPIEARRKVFVLERADAMNEEAANALLKILEEPPGGVIFILITESAAALPVTVRSRCVTFTLTEPDEAEAAEYLAKKLPETGADIIAEALKKSGGNIGRALSVLSGDAAETESDAEFCLSAAARHDVYGLLKVFSKYEKSGARAAQLMNEISRAATGRLSRGAFGTENTAGELGVTAAVKIAETANGAADLLKGNCHTLLTLTRAAAELAAAETK